MFSVPHLIVLFVVVLIVFGPEKLPELARTLGKMMGEFRRATGELRGTLEDHLRDLEREADIRRPGGSTVNPAMQNTIGAPQAALPAAEGTVPANSPHGWTVAPGPNPETKSEETAPGEPSTPEQAATDAAGVMPTQERETLAQAPAPEHETQMPERRRATAKPEDDEQKGNDGGSRPA